MSGERRRLDNIVVVGGSLAGVRTAEALRRLDFRGHLTVIDAERCAPYERYPLSKAFLDPDAPAVALPLRASELDAEHVMGCRIAGVDLARREVAAVDGRRFDFDGLVVATGARVRRPLGAGVLVLRTLDDAVMLRAALDDRPRSVAVVGGGLIGSEVASAVAARGPSVTLVAGPGLPLRRALGESLARHVMDGHRDGGVRALTGRAVGARRRTDGIEVVMDDGSRLVAELVVAATGTVPNVEWLRGSGWDIRDGLRCRPTLYVSGRSDVVAAGDVVRTSYPIPGGLVARVEHWRHAMEQATVAAANLLSGPDRARVVAVDPGYSTRIHGDDVRVSGFPQVADQCRPMWGSVASGEGVLALRRRGWYVGAVALNATQRQLSLLDHLPAVCARRCRLTTVVQLARDHLG